MADKKAAKHIALDFDGTLAHYTKWKGDFEFGEPIQAMVKKVQHELAIGNKVTIFTARVALRDVELKQKIIKAIKAYCKKHIGAELEVTATKLKSFSEFWDDRAIQVVKNTGEFK